MHSHFSSPVSPIQSPPVIADQVSSCKCSIKCRIVDYQEFKQDNKWKRYRSHLLSVTATHDVSNIFNPEYSSIMLEERNLMRDKQQFVFSVFCKKLCTRKLLKIVHHFKSTRNVQKVYGELLQQYEGGTVAQLEEEHIENALKELKSNLKWTKSIVSFHETC